MYNRDSLESPHDIGDPALPQNANHIDGLVDASRAALTIDPNKSADLAEEALVVARSAGLRKAEANCLLALGMARHLLGDSATAVMQFREAQTIYEELSDKLGYANALTQLGNIAAEKTDYQEAKATLLKCKAIYTELDDIDGIADCLNSLGYIEHGWSNFSLAIEHYHEGLRILESAGKGDQCSDLLHNIGVVHAAQGALDEAIKYLSRSLTLGILNNDLHQQAYCHIDLGSCLNRQKKYESALQHQLKALNIREEMGERRQIADSLRAIGSTYTSLQQFDEAIEMLNKARSIRVEIGDRWGVADTDYFLGTIASQLDQSDRALVFFQAAYDLASELEIRVTMLKAAQSIAAVAESCGDLDMAVKYLKEHSKLREEVYSEEKHKHIAELNLLYETERKEQQLRQTQKLEAIGTLAGGIAHDFNNILFAILGNAELALDKQAAARESKRELEAIVTAGKRARELVHQILTFARKSDIQPIPVDCVSLLKEVHKLIRSTLPAMIDVQLRLATDCAVVSADPSHLHQVFMNLCTNASQAMPAAGKLTLSLSSVSLDLSSAVSCGLSEQGEYVLLEVQDTGVGIPLEIQGRIFEPFYTTKSDQEGTGLGLSVVHGIVTELEGSIQVESASGTGTTFKVYLKQHQGAVDQTQVPETAIPQGVGRILIVDDETAIADMLGKMLSKIGYEVAVHTSGLTALAAFKAEPDRYDLVITDMAMPQLSGAELIIDLLQIQPDLPVLITTGYSESLTPETAIELGARELLFKPLSLRELAAAVRSAVENQI